MQPKHTSPKFLRLLPASLSLALLSAALVATAGLPPEEQPKSEAQQPPPAPAIPPELEKMHASQLQVFATSPGFGPVRNRLRRISVDITLAGERYQVFWPDLIALETKPVAYLTIGEDAVNMATITNKAAKVHLRTRPITSLESRAITELRAGKDLVQEADLLKTQPILAKSPVEIPVIRVIGAMRATAGCAKCHEVPQGTLLGAFSYTLVPVSSASGLPLPLNASTLLTP